MKISKPHKLLVAAITIGVAAFLLITNASAAGEVRLYVQPERHELLVGHSINVPVRLNKTTSDKVNYVQMSIRFPANQLEVASISKSGSVFNKDNSLSAVVNNGLGRVDISGHSDYVGEPSNTLVVQLNFRAKAASQSLISFNQGSVAGEYLNANKTKNYITGATGAMVAISPQPAVQAPAPSQPAPVPVTSAPQPEPTVPPVEDQPKPQEGEVAKEADDNEVVSVPNAVDTPVGSGSSIADSKAYTPVASVGGVKSQVVSITLGSLILVALSVAGYFAYKTGWLRQALVWVQMRTSLRNKYRLYQLGAVAVYSASYLDPIAEAVWFKAEESSDEHAGPYAFAGSPEAVAAENETVLDTVYEPESEDTKELAELRMPIMEIEQSAQLVNEELPAPNLNLSNAPILPRPTRSKGIRVPKRHKKFSTLIARK